MDYFRTMNDSPIARVIKSRRPLHILDVMADEAYAAGQINTRAQVDLGGTRTVLRGMLRQRRTGRDLLLYPERGLELNRTAAEIARLCTGEWTVDDIAQHLAHVHIETSPADITRDVRDFLKTLADRGLLRTDCGKAGFIHKTP